jgi:uncharacterized protein YaaW (UPF0174 family)
MASNLHSSRPRFRSEVARREKLKLVTMGKDLENPTLARRLNKTLAAMIMGHGLICSAARAIKTKLLQKPLYLKFIGTLISFNENSSNYGFNATP